MTFEITPYIKGNLPEVQLPDKKFLEILGEEGVRNLANEHYNLLRKSKFSHLFPEDDEEFEKAKLRSSDFFIQILGGHPYFNENRGKPMLVQRHAPFKISPDARLTWLECYREALKKIEMEEAVLASYWQYLDALTMRMINSENELPVFNFQFKK